MKSKSCMKLFGVMCCLSFSLVSSAVFGAPFERPSGDPPNGLKLQGAAKGTKVNVIIAVEFTDVVQGSEFADANEARVTVRLRHGSQLVTLFRVLSGGPTFPVDLAATVVIQAAIIEAIKGDVLSVFGSGGETSVVLKVAEEFASISVPGGSPGGGDSVVVMMDAVLALN